MRLTRRTLLKSTIYGGASLAMGGILGCSSSSGKVLRFANWGGAYDGSALAKETRLIRQEFEKRFSCQLSVEGIPGTQEYVSKMLLSFISGSEPDVMQLDASSAAVFIDNDVLLDLSPFIASEPNLRDAFYPNTVDVYTRGKALYAIPLDFTPMVVYLNMAHFRDRGVAEPSFDWTVEEFLGTAQALTSDDRKGFVFANWMPGWIMWLWNQGGDVLSKDGRSASGYLDSSLNLATFAWLEDLIKVHKVAPLLSQVAALGVNPFANGNASMEVSGHWNMVGLSKATGVDMKDIAIRPMPRGLAGPSQTVIYESGLSIGRNCKQPELAWEFIKYMTSYRVQKRLQMTGLAVCARKDVSQEIALKDSREQDFLKIVPAGRAPWGSKVDGYEFVETEGTKAMENILRMDLEIGAELSEAAVRIDDYLRDRREQ